MKLIQNEVDYGKKTIDSIDSGEGSIFIENVNTNQQIDVKIFYDSIMVGIYFCCIYANSLRIHIAFDKNIGKFNEEITLLIKSSIKKTNLENINVWFKNANRKIIEFVKERFKTSPNGNYYYASSEYIIRRECFKRTNKKCILEIKPYEEKNIDKYLVMLDESMTYIDPEPTFRKRKSELMEHFKKCKTNDSFEAFWEENELIGLYWRKNAEIDIMAVANMYQRKGYGSIILTRAIEMVFEFTKNEFAYLYVVDWNEKGRAFYKKYGMELIGHSYLIQLKK